MVYFLLIQDIICVMEHKITETLLMLCYMLERGNLKSRIITNFPVKLKLLKDLAYSFSIEAALITHFAVPLSSTGPFRVFQLILWVFTVSSFTAGLTALTRDDPSRRR